MKSEFGTQNEEGFTLVELLIYMMLLGIVMTAIYSVFISNVKSHASQENTMEMVQDLRGTVDLMVREIRMAGCDPTNSGIVATFVHDDNPEFTAENHDTDDDSIHLEMDVTDAAGTGGPDGALDGSNEQIIYYHDSTENKILRRTGVPGSRTSRSMAEKISALTFTYFDGDGSPLNLATDPSATTAVRTVQITITGETEDIDPVTGAKKQRVVSTRVRVRNAGL